jgi:ABC-2 type transport system permease protein
VQIQEIQAVNYPPFVDVRPDSMAKDNPITANLPAVTLAWSSPVNAIGAEQAGRKATTLLSSGPQAWATANAQAQPNLDAYPQLGFPVDGPTGARPLAVAVQGAFDSAFAGKTLAAPTPDPNQPETTAPNLNALQSARIDRSPETARLVVIGSSEFLNDTVFDISSSLNPEGPLHSLQLLQNAVDWSVQDLDLLGIRARGTQARVLEALSPSDERFWEVLNYAVALVILIIIGVLWAMRRRNEQPMTLVPETAAAKEA